MTLFELYELINDVAQTLYNEAQEEDTQWSTNDIDFIIDAGNKLIKYCEWYKVHFKEELK